MSKPGSAACLCLQAWLLSQTSAAQPCHLCQASPGAARHLARVQVSSWPEERRPGTSGRAQRLLGFTSMLCLVTTLTFPPRFTRKDADLAGQVGLCLNISFKLLPAIWLEPPVSGSVAEPPEPPCSLGPGGKGRAGAGSSAATPRPSPSAGRTP